MIIDKTKITIRPEKETEYEVVDDLIYKAFSEQHGNETGNFMRDHFIEERKKNTFIAELSLVAVLENGMIVGKVACSETDIVTANGRITQLTLLQSAVLSEYRMQGIMRMLVESVLKKAKDLGYGAVFLGGNPALYGRFGFEPSCKYGIYHKDREKWGEEGVIICVLTACALDRVTGTTYYYGG